MQRTPRVRPCSTAGVSGAGSLIRDVRRHRKRMDLSGIYVHDGKLLRVIEEPEHSRLTMHVELPVLERGERLEPRLLVFEDVYGYQVVEGYINGCTTMLDLSVVGK